MSTKLIVVISLSQVIMLVHLKLLQCCLPIISIKLVGESHLDAHIHVDKLTLKACAQTLTDLEAHTLCADTHKHCQTPRQ